MEDTKDSTPLSHSSEHSTFKESSSLQAQFSKVWNQMLDHNSQEPLQAKVGRLEKIFELILEALEEDVPALSAHLLLSKLVSFLEQYPTDKTILDYTYMQALLLITFFTFWEYSIHQDDQILEELELVKRGLERYYARWKKEWYVLSVPLLEQVSSCVLLLDSMPEGKAFFRMCILLLGAGFPFLSQQSECLFKLMEMKPFLATMLFKKKPHAKNSGQAFKLLEGFALSHAIVTHKGTIILLLDKLQNAPKWQDSVLYLGLIRRIVTILASVQNRPENEKIIRLALGGNQSMSGLFTYFRPRSKGKKMDLVSKDVRRHFYLHVLQKVLESIFISSHLKVLSTKEVNLLIEQLEEAEWTSQEKFKSVMKHKDELIEGFGLLFSREKKSQNQTPHRHTFKRMSSYLPHLKVIEEEKSAVLGLPSGHFKDDNNVEFPLHDKLKPFRDMLLIHRCVQVVGPGGTGKTYFAVEAARQMRIIPKMLLSFKNKSTLVAQLASLGRQAKSTVIGFFKPQEASDLRVLGKKLRANLEQNKEYFLILDNLAQDQFLQGFLENGALEKGFVVVASRVQLESAPQVYKMGELDEASCVATLSDKLDGNHLAAAKMYKTCEGRPLKLSQLFHYIEETNYDLEQFAQEGIAAEKILALTVETLVTSESDALFSCLKYLNSGYIPEAFLEFVGRHFLLDAQDIDNFFQDILAFEFCQPTHFQGILRLHDDLQESLPEFKTSPLSIWTLYNQFLTKLRLSEFNEEAGPFEIEQMMRHDLKKWVVLHDNLLSIGTLDQSEAQQVPGDRECLVNLGTALFLLPFNMESVVLGVRLDRLIKKELSALTPQFSQTEFQKRIQACNYLNSAAVDRGLYSRCLENFERMLELEKQFRGGKESRWTMNIRASIASEFQRMGKLQDCFQFRKEILDWRQEHLGAEHPDTLSAMNNFALSLKQMKRFEEALQVREKVREVMAKTMGKEHPDLLTAMNNLAMSLKDTGKTEKALQMMQSVLELRKTHLGEDHPDTLTAINNLASILSAKGQFREALQALKSVYQLRVGLQGEKHRLSMATLNNMAAAHGELGEYEEALRLQKKVVELRKKVQGESHPAVHIAENGVAYFSGKLEESKEAN